MSNSALCIAGKSANKPFFTIYLLRRSPCCDGLLSPVTKSSKIVTK